MDPIPPGALYRGPDDPPSHNVETHVAIAVYSIQPPVLETGLSETRDFDTTV